MLPRGLGGRRQLPAARHDDEGGEGAQQALRRAGLADESQGPLCKRLGG